MRPDTCVRMNVMSLTPGLRLHMWKKNRCDWQLELRSFGAVRSDWLIVEVESEAPSDVI